MKKFEITADIVEEVTIFKFLWLCVSRMNEYTVRFTVDEKDLEKAKYELNSPNITFWSFKEIV